MKRQEPEENRCNKILSVGKGISFNKEGYFVTKENRADATNL